MPWKSKAVARAHAARRLAEVSVVVLDRSRDLSPDDEEILAVTARRRRVVVANKLDLPPRWPLEQPGSIDGLVPVSAVTGAGFDELRATIIGTLAGHARVRDTPAVTNIRHVELLSRAAAALRRASTATGAETPEEFVAADVTEARALLEEVTGTRTADDVLHTIFDKFCIGK